MRSSSKRDLASFVLGSMLVLGLGQDNLYSSNGPVDSNNVQTNYRNDGGPSSLDLAFFGITALGAGYLIRKIVKRQ